MSNGTLENQNSSEGQKELKVLYQRLNTSMAAQKMWKRFLSENEREELGGSVHSFDEHYRQFGTVGIYMNLRNVDQPRAIVELAHELGYVLDAEARWLFREIGESESASIGEPVNCPVWDRASGELRFRGKLVRKLRVTKKPRLGCVILDAFTEEGWPKRIDSPIPGGSLGRKLSNAVN